MDADIRYITIVCLAGILGLGAIFGLAAKGDASGRQKWHQLASRVGLKAQTFFRVGRIRLYGGFQGRYVTVEQYWTPDPHDPHNVEKGILWARIMMATKNTRQTVFMFGRLDVLSHAAGWFAKQFETTTSITPVDPEYPRTIFVTPASTRLIQSLRERISALEYVLVAANTPCYFQLDGSHLSYTELGSELMDSDDIETSAGRLKRTLDLMKVIVQHVEMYPA